MGCSTPKDPQKLGAQCQLCPFACQGRPNQPVMGEGTTDAAGVLVGEGPGSEEAEVGRPFVGATGKRLDRSLADQGIWRSTIFIVNATACRPPINKTEPMMKAATEACRPAFMAQVQPFLDAKKPFITMGRWAWHSLAGSVPKGGVEDGRGFIRQLPGGSQYVATWHPTYAYFRNPFVWGAFETDLNKFKRMMTGKLAPRPSRIITNATWRDIERLAREPYNIACDIETAPQVPDKPWTGKDPTRARLRTLGFGNKYWGLSFRWETATGRTRDAAATLLKTWLRYIIWQNGFWFDHRVLERHGLQVLARAEDTRDARRAVSATSKLDLGYLATMYDDPPVWWSEGLVTRAPKTPAEWRELETYNAIDCVEDARVWEGIQREPEWSTQRVQGIYDLNKRMSQVAARMHSRGLLLNDWNRGVLQIGLQEEFEIRKQRFLDAVGLPNMEMTPDCLRAIIYKRHEREDLKLFSLPDPFTDDRYTEAGKISVGSGSLLMLITDPSTPDRLKTLIDLWWRANAPRKGLSTYVTSAKIDEATGDDGRLRAGWNCHGADTRWSCSEPNLQNISVEKKD